MRATDLMIGDWVKSLKEDHSGEYGQVIDIDHHDTVLLEYQCVNYYTDVEHIEPIPLTPEILEKNGFRIDKEDTGDLEYYCLGEVGEETCVVVKKHALNALEDLDVIWSIYVEDFAIYDKILYVHELQHALKLCGIEKTIEL